MGVGVGVGVGVGLLLLTVTVIVNESPAFPAASHALTNIECEPSLSVVVFRLKLYGATRSCAFTNPSTIRYVSVTPTLSVAVAVTVIVPTTVAPLAGLVSVTVGGVTSGVTLGVGVGVGATAVKF